MCSGTCFCSVSPHIDSFSLFSSAVNRRNPSGASTYQTGLTANICTENIHSFYIFEQLLRPRYCIRQAHFFSLLILFLCASPKLWFHVLFYQPATNKKIRNYDSIINNSTLQDNENNRILIMYVLMNNQFIFRRLLRCSNVCLSRL